MEPNKYIVIGSGPSSVSCALALIERNIPVVMLDKGSPTQIDLNVSSEKMYNSFFANNFRDLKPHLGSFYPYDLDFEILQDKSNILPSSTEGGFSEVWGRVVFPFGEEDLDAWPVKTDALKESYEYVSQRMMSIHSPDQDGNRIPCYSGHSEIIPTTKAVKQIIEKLRKRDLRKNRLYIESTRIACHIKEKVCTSCGDCIAGCKEDVLFSSRSIIRQLQKSSLFTLISGANVMSFKEENDGVIVTYQNQENEICTLEGKKLFLGTGVIPTFNIIQNSVPVKLEKIILDSQYYIIPFLSLKPLRKPDEPYGSLCQWVMGLEAGQISSQRIHMQFYGYNEVYGSFFHSKLGAIYRLFHPLFKILERRLGVIQVFLHSDDSNTLTIRKNTQIQLTLNERTRFQVKKLYAKLSFLLRAGIIPLVFATKQKKAGSSFHSGGTFPMQKNPRDFETDSLGRLLPLKNVHLIDSSILPSIPATTVTLSLMANAYRIGSKV